MRLAFILSLRFRHSCRLRHPCRGTQIEIADDSCLELVTVFAVDAVATDKRNVDALSMLEIDIERRSGHSREQRVRPHVQIVVDQVL